MKEGFPPIDQQLSFPQVDEAQDKCQSCGAPIRWLTTPGGQRAPLDVAPLMRWTKLPDGWALVKCFRPHFERCPNAHEWRGARR